MVWFSVVLNPYIYGYFNTPFREAVENILDKQDCSKSIRMTMFLEKNSEFDPEGGQEPEDCNNVQVHEVCN